MSTSRVMAWSVWLIASIFYAYQYILRVMPNIMMGDILTQFNIDTATFGQFSGVYYIGYSLMHLPIGILLDRFGAKKVMPVCILLTVIGLMPLLFASFWLYPILGRALIGIGSSAAILGTFKVVRVAFSEAKFTRMLSFSVTIGLIGAIYGGGPVNYMCQELGYKTVVAIFAALGVVLALVTYMILPRTTAEPDADSSVISNLREVFSNFKVLAFCFFAGLMVGPLEGFADVWGTQFLKQVYGLDSTISASLPSLIFMGMCFGAPVLSLIAEKSGNAIGTIAASGAVMAGCFFALLTGQIPVTAIGIMFVAVGVCSAYQIIAIYQASTYVKENVVGLTTAVANMIIMIFGYAFHTIIGGVISSLGSIESSAFVYGIAVIPVALTLGTMGFLVILFQERKASKAVPA